MLVRLLFWLHLIVPLLIGVDGLLALREREFGGFEKVALAGSAVWLAAGLAVELVGPLRRRLAPILPKATLAVYAVLLSIVALELGARLIPDGHDRRLFVRPPSQQWTRKAPPAAKLPGVDAVSTVSSNEVGLRGPSADTPPGTYRIITVGGSTTECIYLDDSQEWPRLVMDGLTQAGRPPGVWVANGGYAGHTAVHHLALLRTIAVFDRADAWILMPGINDLQSTLAREGAATQAALEDNATKWLHGRGMRLSKARMVLPFRRLLVSEDDATAEQWYGRNRAKRSRGPIIPIPDLTVGLAEYRDRILRLAAECRARGKRCLMLTQPTMWRSDLPPDLEALLWFGWIGPREAPKGFASPGDLERAMRQYNDVMLSACREGGVECLDLAARIPKDTTAMFDDCHFNINGARLVANAIVEYLRARASSSSPG